MTVHGVPEEEWYRLVTQVRREMETPDGLARMGLARVYCEDPDCGRLSRSGTPGVATYVLTRDLPAVEVVDAADAGHPTEAGAHLCWACAKTAITKRRLDAARRGEGR